VLICELIVHLLVIVQNNKRCAVHVLKYQKYNLPLDHSPYYRCKTKEYALWNDVILQEGAHLLAATTLMTIGYQDYRIQRANNRLARQKEL